MPSKKTKRLPQAGKNEPVEVHEFLDDHIGKLIEQHGFHTFIDAALSACDMHVLVDHAKPGTSRYNFLLCAMSALETAADCARHAAKCGRD